MPLSKLVTLEEDVRMYLASILVDAVARANQVLYVPEGLSVVKMGPTDW